MLLQNNIYFCSQFFIHKDVRKSDILLIGFKTLDLGEHLFEYQIDEEFFSEMKNEEIHNGELSVKVLVDKSERLLKLHFDIEGQIETICDRCLGEMMLPVKIEEEVFVKFGIKTYEEAENVLILSEEEYELNLRAMVNEFIILSRPMRAVHSQEGDDTCDVEMLKKIEEYQQKKSVDPRWAALEKLKNK